MLLKRLNMMNQLKELIILRVNSTDTSNLVKQKTIKRIQKN